MLACVMKFFTHLYYVRCAFKSASSLDRELVRRVLPCVNGLKRPCDDVCVCVCDMFSASELPVEWRGGGLESLITPHKVH